MKKFLKGLLFIGGTALAAHYGMKTYKKINSAVKLSKSLPEFLNNVYGEKPTMNMNKTLNSLSLKLGFSQEILDKHSDIETTVREYIDDFYPELSKNSIDISIEAGNVEETPAEPEAPAEPEEV